jgi:phage gpG-like protein
MKIDLNTAEADAVLAELERRLLDKTELMQDIGELMVESTRQNFVVGTSPDGIPWAPKSQATLDAYEARGETVSTKPLIGPSKTLSTTIFAQPTPTSVAWGSNMIQAAVMQFGAQAGQFGARIGRDKNGRDFIMSIPWGDIPARPFIGVGTDDRDAIIATTKEFLERAGDAS